MPCHLGHLHVETDYLLHVTPNRVHLDSYCPTQIISTSTKKAVDQPVQHDIHMSKLKQSPRCGSLTHASLPGFSLSNPNRDPRHSQTRISRPSRSKLGRPRRNDWLTASRYCTVNLIAAQSLTLFTARQTATTRIEPET